MDFILNFIFAWIGVVLALLLSIIYILRIVNILYNNQNKWIAHWHKKLRINHKFMGIILVAMGLIHGLYSSDKVWSINLGTGLWIVSILLGLNWMFRKIKVRLNPWIHTHRLLMILFLILIPIHIIDVGGIQIDDEARAIFQDNFAKTTANRYTIQPLHIPGSGNQSHANAATTENANQTSNVSIQSDLRFEDGLYQGSADAYGPNLQVEVVIENNVIARVEVIGHNEDKPRFYNYPIAVIPVEIVTANSTEVDSISGATFTSIGIKNAVHNALKVAVIGGELPPLESLPPNRRR